MKTLFIEYKTFETGGEPSNPEEDGEAYIDREPSFIEVSFLSLLRQQRPGLMFYDSVEVSDKTFKGKAGYLAVVRYTTGNTFGTTFGSWHIVGCTSTQETAKKLLNKALTDPKSYKPWEGFFEKFERTEIHQLDIK